MPDALTVVVIATSFSARVGRLIPVPARIRPAQVASAVTRMARNSGSKLVKDVERAVAKLNFVETDKDAQRSSSGVVGGQCKENCSPPFADMARAMMAVNAAGVVKAGINVSRLLFGAVVSRFASSRLLAESLKLAGHARPAESAAHHIVAGRAADAAVARAVLRKFGIGINSAANGVWLPATKAAANPTGAAVHSTLHTKAYYQTVNKMLGQATTLQEVEVALDTIRAKLLSGGL